MNMILKTKVLPLNYTPAQLIMGCYHIKTQELLTYN